MHAYAYRESWLLFQVEALAASPSIMLLYTAIYLFLVHLQLKVGANAPEAVFFSAQVLLQELLFSSLCRDPEMPQKSCSSFPSI